MAGVTEPDSGEVEEEIKIAYKPQYILSDFEGTVQDFLFTHAKGYGTNVFKTDISKPYDLEKILEKEVNKLSGGELQRFSILRALNPQTKFIIADEISTMLDAVTQVQIWEALINHCRANNIGILAVSHDKDLLDVICDDILYFKEINQL